MLPGFIFRLRTIIAGLFAFPVVSSIFFDSHLISVPDFVTRFCTKVSRVRS